MLHHAPEVQAASEAARLHGRSTSAAIHAEAGQRANISPWPGTHRLLSSSFLGLPYRILNMNHKKELLRSLWVLEKNGKVSHSEPGRRPMNRLLMRAFAVQPSKAARV